MTDRPDRDPVARLLRQRARALMRHVPSALQGDEAAVHGLRVAGRRLRLALVLMSDEPEGRPVLRMRARLKRMTRAAGASRDFDVGLELLNRRSMVSLPSSPQLDTLGRELVRARTRSHAIMKRRLAEQDLGDLEAGLRRLVEEPAPLFPFLYRIRQTREALAEAVLAAFEEVGDRYEPEALHRLRIRVRRLRYVSEFSDALREEDSAATARLEELQERLGAVQDPHVLALWLRRQGRRASRRGRAALAAAARSAAASYQAASASRHAELLAGNPVEAFRALLRAMDDKASPRPVTRQDYRSEMTTP